MKDKLIRRDTPLTAGMKVEVRVETVYTLDVDDWLDGEPSITVAEIEENLQARGRHIDAALIDAGYKGEYADDNWYMQLPVQVICTCGGSSDEGNWHHAVACPAVYESKVIDARFETPYEQEQRERGGHGPYGDPPVYVAPGRVAV